MIIYPHCYFSGKVSRLVIAYRVVIVWGQLPVMLVFCALAWLSLRFRMLYTRTCSDNMWRLALLDLDCFPWSSLSAPVGLSLAAPSLKLVSFNFQFCDWHITFIYLLEAIVHTVPVFSRINCLSSSWTQSSVQVKRALFAIFWAWTVYVGLKTGG